MAADKCMNRNHCLGTPPPSREDHVLPRHGCMTCLDGSDLACPYRATYECSDATQLRGLSLGHCAVEQDLRDHERLQFPTVAAEAGDRGDAARLRLELYLDALVYSIRANAWMSVAWEIAAAAKSDPWTDPGFSRAFLRYQSAANERLVYRTHELSATMSQIEVERQERLVQVEKERAAADREARLEEYQVWHATFMARLRQGPEYAAPTPADPGTSHGPETAQVPAGRLRAPSLPTRSGNGSSGGWAQARRSTLPGGRTLA